MVVVVVEGCGREATLVVVTVVVMVEVRHGWGWLVVGRDARSVGGVVVVVLVTVTFSVHVPCPPEVAWSFWMES